MNDSPDIATDDRSDPARALQDWRPATRVRSPDSPADWSRRRLAGIIIVIALIYPFYSAGVERVLQRIELERAAREFERIAAEAQGQAAEQLRRNVEAARTHAALADERDLQARIAAVRVTGAVDGSPPSVVVDRLPPEGAAEAAAVICRQASSLLRRPLSGETLRVMRDQDQRPISQAGQVHCL